jgi:hypothetical protein
MDRFQKRTGIALKEYPVCEKGCYCFAATPHYLTCPKCGAERPVDENGDPAAELARVKFWYIEVIHRIRLWFTDPCRVQQMRGHRQWVNRRLRKSRDKGNPRIEDHWVLAIIS